MVAINFEKFKRTSRIAVLTGAGISAESGIPTFRGNGGLWKNFRAEELATPEVFHRDPILVWEWYNMRRETCGKAQPNPGHKVIAEFENLFHDFHLFTQNVDNLHARAGSRKLTELHGNIFTGRCTNCSAITYLNEPLENTMPPKCKICDQNLRPHILWFGENYDNIMLETAADFLSGTDIIFIVGTSAHVTVPVQLANIAIQNKAYSIEINPEVSILSQRVNVSIRSKSGEVLPEILKKIKDLI